MGIFGGIIKMSIRAKHGLPLEDRSSRRNRFRGGNDGSDIEAQRKIELLSSENERLTGQIGRLEERLRVLERIATDPAERVSREIEDLRTRD
ncbi:hypothetical protein FPZ24_07390 [Sphingomonas panacisoli]|uniref:Uncharacterized protein n=1 Tax=Sphingomonas panacisoli TaxID=1813879 RepID=A0A5B8LN89_9SPHN|nr:hypothetical protein [Sphingomonas panacisoli]QDZ09094.1 hypothetical protein FPZ24_07390 [Sphingomonas panacisoli]